MKEFLLVFRADVKNNEQPSPQQMQAMMTDWQDWMGGLAAQNKLVDAGNRLASEGRVVAHGNVVTNGPYVEIKEAIGGYTIVRAKNIDEAAGLAGDCPILAVNGNVEVREIVAMENNG